MSSLHLVHSSQGCERASRLSGADDDIVLMGDAVYGEIEGAYALQDDVIARGLSHSKQVTYSELVDLSLRHDKVVSWP